MNYVFTYYCYCCLLLLIVSIVAMNCVLVSSSWVVAIAMMNMIDVLQWKWWCNCCSVFSCDMYFANAILNVNCHDSAVVLDCYRCIIFWASGKRFWENTSPNNLIGENRVSFRPSFWSNKTPQSTPKNSRNGSPNTIFWGFHFHQTAVFPKCFQTSQPSQQLFFYATNSKISAFIAIWKLNMAQHWEMPILKHLHPVFFLEIKNLGVWISGTFCWANSKIFTELSSYRHQPVRWTRWTPTSETTSEAERCKSDEAHVKNQWITMERSGEKKKKKQVQIFEICSYCNSYFSQRDVLQMLQPIIRQVLFQGPVPVFPSGYVWKWGIPPIIAI